MNDLVINYNGTPATTQDKVSVLTDNNEQSVQRLIRTYEADLREFGELNFHNVQVKAGLGLTYRKVYCLNEQQATLLLTYMKNTAKVREAKKILVKAFYDMRQKLQECQINGYKGQLAQHNAVIVDLRNQLKAYEFKAEPITKIERLEADVKYYKALAHNHKMDKEFYQRKTAQAEAELDKMERVGMKGLELVLKQLDDVYTAIGAIRAFINDGDEFFMKQNKILERIDQ